MKTRLVTIRSDVVEATIDVNGGAFHSLIDRRSGEQLLWQGDERWWDQRDLVLFPFVCRRKDGYYTVDGKRYEMDLHGFAKDGVFSVERLDGDSVTLVLRSSESTKRVYPFEFTFRVNYALKRNKARIEYEIINDGDRDMYFSVGGHIGVRLNKQSGNEILFEKAIDRIYSLLGNFVDGENDITPLVTIEPTKAFMKKHATFIGVNEGEGALVFKRAAGTSLRFTYGSPIISLWTNPDGGDYYCIEPWWGLPDEADPKREIAHKKLINRIQPNTSFRCGYGIELL